MNSSMIKIMDKWQLVTTEAPKIGERVWVAYHGHGEIRVDICIRENNRMMWGDWDYINSHDGEPKYWHPLQEPAAPPDDIAGPNCGCDGCTEKHYPLEEDSPDSGGGQR